MVALVRRFFREACGSAICPRCRGQMVPPQRRRTAADVVHHLHEATLDHIVPISWGGQNSGSEDNLQILCRSCHERKTAREKLLLLAVMAGEISGPDAVNRIQDEWSVGHLRPPSFPSPRSWEVVA